MVGNSFQAREESPSANDAEGGEQLIERIRIEGNEKGKIKSSLEGTQAKLI